MKQNYRFSEAKLKPVNDYFPNPFCGWYDIVRATLTENGAEYAFPETDNTLILLEINISAFSQKPISEKALCAADNMLCELSKNRAIILRWAYDFAGHGWEAEPEKIETVLEHIRSTGSICKKYSNKILTVQGLFVGSWGEMHSSKFLSRNSINTLYKEMLNSYGKIPIAVRTADIHKMIFFGSAENQKRTGIFNDAIMGSENDLGSFNNDRTAAADTFAELCEIAPYGGEILLGDGFDSAECCRYLCRSNTTYLNYSYDTAALDRLKKDSVNGMTAYDYISVHLGYRICVVKVRMIKNSITVTLRNDGFAKNYRPVEIIINSVFNDKISVINLEGNSVIRSGQTEEYKAEISVCPSKLYLNMTVSGEDARFANESDSYGVYLGEILACRGGLKR